MVVRQMRGEPMEQTLAWAEAEVTGFMRSQQWPPGLNVPTAPGGTSWAHRPALYSAALRRVSTALPLQIGQADAAARGQAVLARRHHSGDRSSIAEALPQRCQLWARRWKGRLRCCFGGIQGNSLLKRFDEDLQCFTGSRS
jgi:hypothetical protein